MILNELSSTFIDFESNLINCKTFFDLYYSCKNLAVISFKNHLLLSY